MATYTAAEAAEIVRMAASARLTLAETSELLSDGLSSADVARLLGQTRRLAMPRRPAGTRPPLADDVTPEEKL
jgi:hypothetical protein